MQHAPSQTLALARKLLANRRRLRKARAVLARNKAEAMEAVYGWKAAKALRSIAFELEMKHITLDCPQ
jgi:hypothetical protein